MSLIKSIAVFLCGLVASQAQVPNFGSCPKVKVVQDFDASAYLGRWYEHSKYFAFFELGGKCITADYSPSDKADTIKVLNTQYNQLTQSPRTIEGFAKLTGNPGEAKLGVEFPSVPYAGVGPYWVLGTDYTSYAVVWSCSDVRGFINARIAWILTREPKPPQSVLEEAYKVMDKNGVSRAPLITTDQTGCPE